MKGKSVVYKHIHSRLFARTLGSSAQPSLSLSISSAKTDATCCNLFLPPSVALANADVAMRGIPKTSTFFGNLVTPEFWKIFTFYWRYRLEKLENLGGNLVHQTSGGELKFWGDLKPLGEGDLWPTPGRYLVYPQPYNVLVMHVYA